MRQSGTTTSDKSEICLPEVRVDRIIDFVFVNFDPNTQSIADYAPGLEEQILSMCPDLPDYNVEEGEGGLLESCLPTSTSSAPATRSNWNSSVRVRRAARSIQSPSKSTIWRRPPTLRSASLPSHCPDRDAPYPSII